MAEVIKSFEEATGVVFGDILSKKKENRDVRIGLFTCGYFEYWRMYPETLRKNVENDLAVITKKLKSEFKNVVCSGLVDTIDKADAAGKLFQESNIDVLVVVEGTYIPDFISLHAINHVRHVPLLLFSMQVAEDMDPNSNYEHSLRNSGIIGIAQLSGTLRKMDREYEVIVGSVHDDSAYEKLRSFVRAAGAIENVRESNIGVIGHVFRGMYDLELSKTFFKSKFDANIIYIQSAHLLSEWEKVTNGEIKRQTKALLERFKTRGVSEDDVSRAVRLAIAMQNLAERFNLNSMCFLDQHFLQRQTLTTARIGASLLMENTDLTVTCEGDLGGLVMMMMMRSISGVPALMGEWGEYDLSRNSVFIIGHGIGVPRLAESDDAITLTRTPEEWGFTGAGLNYELIVKPGTATLGHFIETKSGYKMLVTPCESIPYPKLAYEELHAMVKVKTPVKSYLETIFKSGVTHHCILGLSDMSGALVKAAELMHIEALYIE